ncbi:hypothetical protein E2562_026911 [Oryza meyeriana var. granulata]|uniref:Uncharacterized protein n=1 Tax=Oryza meyeriana var. granulata TaxID=110450 RepID=A0A6G1CTE7_9ORYZ|nr:hypothetical protein E2562_026911 [Oryza meyeriana var. granulata]
MQKAQARVHHQTHTTATAPPRAPSVLQGMELGGITSVQTLQVAKVLLSHLSVGVQEDSPVVPWL